jgi:hypothetical protein
MDVMESEVNEGKNVILTVILLLLLYYEFGLQI